MGQLSRWQKVKCGVPEGSVLGSIFLVSTLLILLAASSTHIVFLQMTQTKISSWLVAKMLVLNLEKTIQLKLILVRLQKDRLKCIYIHFINRANICMKKGARRRNWIQPWTN